MEINAVNIAWNKFFCGKLSTVNKKVGGRKKKGELSAEAIQEIMDNAVPVTTKKTCLFFMRE